MCVFDTNFSVSLVLFQHQVWLMLLFTGVYLQKTIGIFSGSYLVLLFSRSHYLKFDPPRGESGPGGIIDRIPASLRSFRSSLLQPAFSSSESMGCILYGLLQRACILFDLGAPCMRSTLHRLACLPSLYPPSTFALFSLRPTLASPCDYSDTFGSVLCFSLGLF